MLYYSLQLNRVPEKCESDACAKDYCTHRTLAWKEIMAVHPAGK